MGRTFDVRSSKFDVRGFWVFEVRCSKFEILGFCSKFEKLDYKTQRFLQQKLMRKEEFTAYFVIQLTEYYAIK